MKKNTVYQLIAIPAVITSILDGSYLESAKQAKKALKPISWSDTNHTFVVSIIKIGTGKNAKFKLNILCDGKSANKAHIKYSQHKIANQLLQKKSEFAKAITACKEVMFRSEKFRYCYFWEGDNGNQNARNYYSRQWSVPEYAWNDGENDWSVSYSVTQSRKNTYASGEYRKNGQVTNLNAVRHQLILLQQLESMINEALGQPDDEQAAQPNESSRTAL